MDREKLIGLVYENYETELGGIQVYTKAIECAVNEDLREELEKYLEETTHHVEVARGLLTTYKVDPDVETPGRQVVRHIGQSLVEAMEMARSTADPSAAEIVT